jgi:hypothetical protein
LEVLDHHQVRAVAHALAEKDGLTIRRHAKARTHIAFDLRQQQARIAGELEELKRVPSIIAFPADIERASTACG